MAGDYTSQSSHAAPARESIISAAAATGRRKEAIARVRIVPGTGRWVVNGGALADYFPNKVHQQAVAEPFRTLEVDGRYDVLAEEFVVEDQVARPVPFASALPARSTTSMLTATARA